MAHIERVVSGPTGEIELFCHDETDAPLGICTRLRLVAANGKLELVYTQESTNAFAMGEEPVSTEKHEIEPKALIEFIKSHGTKR
jgi:hypothetical protein